MAGALFRLLQKRWPPILSSNSEHVLVVKSEDDSDHNSAHVAYLNIAHASDLSSAHVSDLSSSDVSDFKSSDIRETPTVIVLGINRVHVGPFGPIFGKNRSHRFWEKPMKLSRSSKPPLKNQSVKKICKKSKFQNFA